MDREWIVNSPEQFCWSVWKDEEDVVLFHQGSGETLLLNPMGEFVLKRLQAGRMTQDQLVENAADFFDLEVDDELKSSISVSLHTFRTLGLVISDSI